MKKLVIIPAYNEAENLPHVIADIRTHAADYEYIIINDASTDATKAVCEENGFSYLDLASNLGIGGAVQTGYQYAYLQGYDLAVQMDGDGQHKAESLPLLEQALLNENEAADMVIGSRFIDKEGFQSTSLRRFAIKWISAWIKLLTGNKITDPTSGLRMCGRRVIEVFADSYPWDYPEPESTTGLLVRGYRVKEVAVQMRPRRSGKSSIAKPLSALFYMIKVTLGIFIEALGGKQK